MYKIQIDDNGNPIAIPVLRTDKELVEFSYRYLMMSTPLTETICSSINRNTNEYFPANYVLNWNGWNDLGEWVTYYVGINDHKGKLAFYAIAERYEEFEIVSAHNELFNSDERLQNEFEQERFNELCYKNSPKFLVTAKSIDSN